jgi:hypothetical protein
MLATTVVIALMLALALLIANVEFRPMMLSR